MVIMPHVITFHIEPTEELTYRGEGNSSLVVALQSKRKVIRLLKSDAKKLKNDEDVHSLLLQHIDFNENILPATLPRFFFSPPQLICLDPLQLEQIRNLVKDKRPSFRLDKTISNCDYALLMPDYCCIPKCISLVAFTSGHTLSIEIKPKQGFLPLLDLFLEDPSLRIKSEICRFGLSQFYKHQKESISSISSYCPLDLFSGCRVRALHALFSLIDNPQNNFRVFCDAQLIYGDQYYGKSGNVDYLQGVLAKFLSKDSSSVGYANGHSNGSVQRNGYVNGYANSRANKQTNGHYNMNGHTTKKCHTKTNGQNGLNYSNGDSNGHSHPADVLATFCTLLLDALYDDKIAKNIPEMDSQHNLSIVREFEKAKSKKHCTEPRFIRTFMQMFDLNTAYVPTPTPVPSGQQQGLNKNDINNNQINGLFNGDLLNGNIGATSTNGHNRTGRADLLNNNTTTTNKDSTKTKSESTCHFHRSPCCGSDRPCQSTLPKGCVLDSILRAQKLDLLDSSMAVQLYDRLVGQYHDLKRAHYGLPAQPPMVECFANDKYAEFIDKFVHDNLDDLEKLWRFLISLTAKDCSIMVAIQRADPTSVSRGLGIVQQGTSMCTLVEDAESGVHYVVSVSITDLDFKQAYKIQRSLHNDRRMIKAFWKALRNEPSSFPPELVNNSTTTTKLISR